MLLAWLLVASLLHPCLVACGACPAPALVLTDLRGQVAVVTGANTGIGFRTATNLAKCGATVVFACRSEAKARAAMAATAHEVASCGAAGGGRTGEDWGAHCVLRFEALDLASLASVRACARRLEQTYPPKSSGGGGGIGILVLNAGLNTRGVTSDGFDARWQVNYLGHWLLASKLLPLLRCARGPRNNGARVVCLSSVMHHLAVPSHFALHCAPQLRTPSTPPPLRSAAAADASCYADSKLAMHLLACELQRRFDAEPADDTTPSGDDDLVEVPESGGRGRARGSGKNNGSGGGGKGAFGGGGCDDDDEHHSGPRFIGRRASSAAATLAADSKAAAGGAALRVRRPRCVTVNPGAVASDIWRGVPARLKAGLLDPLMALAFLSTDEGCATSLHAATQPLPPATPPLPPTPPFLPYLRWGAGPAAGSTWMDAAGDGGGGGDDGPWAEVPYYAPYFVPRGCPRWLRLPFEAAGPFAGARLCPQSLPPNARAASAQLWRLSAAAVHDAEAMSEAAEAQGGMDTMAHDKSASLGMVPPGNDHHQALLGEGHTQ